jgi:hypothetical protein
MGPDANNDGVVDNTDATCLLRQVNKLPPTAECPQPLPRGDVNADGLVNALDYLCVRNYLDGKPRTPTCPYDPPVHASTFSPATSGSSVDEIVD